MTKLKHWQVSFFVETVKFAEPNHHYANKKGIEYNYY